MRRGHPGSGGWRGENIRHPRARGGGPPYFGPSRGHFQGPSRFPPSALHRSHSNYNVQSEIAIEHQRQDHDRNRFRRGHQGHIFHDRNNTPNQRRHNITPFDNPSQFYGSHTQGRINQFNVNSHGDVDQRHLPLLPEPVNKPTIWNKISDKSKFDCDARNYYRENANRHHDVDDRTLDYTGHRPPASDHYGGTMVSTIDNSNTFTRSVDDTVNIVRKRLMNRSESQHSNHSTHDHQSYEEDRPSEGTSDYQETQQTPITPIRRRIQRQRLNIQTNCDKIKGKIVNQLFKMDKDKIHKLMDNPNSSTKFEYAISSLITESQNSLNRHMRSVAEKSLTTSKDFIHRDNDTIYEDTFMKQMQFILDPQDTVLLEDIKPMVLAEIQKVLQLNDLDQNCEVYDNTTTEILEHSDQYNDQYQGYDEEYYQNRLDYEIDYPNNVPGRFEVSETLRQNVDFEESKPLFERRPAKTNKADEKRASTESRRLSAKTTEYDTSASIESEHSQALFDVGAEQFSEEEDPFAELDKQYHVAVDPNYIETDDIILPPQEIKSQQPMPKKLSPIHKSFLQKEDNRGSSRDNILAPKENSYNIIKEIDEQLHTLSKSPLKVVSSNNNNNIDGKSNESINPVKQENKNVENISITENLWNVKLKQEICDIKSKVNDKEHIAESTNKSSIQSNARKRSTDQKPSHRKEKRKKSETTSPEANNQILNKNIIINVNDCAVKNTEKYDSGKSVFNLFFTKTGSNAKTDEKKNKTDKEYSDKYVKRKETPKKTSDKEMVTEKRNNSISSSNEVMMSPPKLSSNSNTSSSQCASKTESKKLKTIDMFSEQPKKKSIVQQNPRNTALQQPEVQKHVPTISPKEKLSTTKAKSVKQINVTTPVHKKYISKLTQTLSKKFIHKGIQTDPMQKEKSCSQDPFERMKEIDLEIQTLLQEKFKLYNNMESKNVKPSEMPSLGVTVLTPSEKDTNDAEETSTEDSIVEDFTSIPVEELEQIALESVPVQKSVPKLKINLKRKQVVKETKTKASKPLKKVNKQKKPNTPNISLLEQILDDERPLEDIISLEDLESAYPVKNNKKKPQPKKKVKNQKPTPENVTKKQDLSQFNLKDFSIVIERTDIRAYLKPNILRKSQTPDLKDDTVTKENDTIIVIEPIPTIKVDDDEVEEIQHLEVAEPDHEETIIEETITDIHFDMLDVSEDIVIADNVELKSHDDKDTSDEKIILTNNEITLDNSQSSSVEAMPLDSTPGQTECKTYDYSTDENLKRDSITVSGNADAVLAIECIENNFLAACLDGCVYYFSSEGQLLTTLRGSNLAVTCLTIVKEKYGTTVYTGSLDSRIRYYDLETGLEKGPECNVLSPIQTMDRAWDTVFVGTRTGFVLQFECKNNMLIPVSTVKFSEQSILALRAMKEGPRKVLLVAARSENVTIKDAMSGLLLRTLDGPKMTVYTLLFEDGKVYCGTSSHQIHVFDYSSGSHVGTHTGGKGAVCLRASGGLVFAGCYDGCVYVYREGEGRPLAQLQGPGLMLLSLAIVGSKIIAGYKDRSLYIWKIPLSILQEMVL